MIVPNMASALWTASEMVELSTPVVSPTTCSKPLAVSQHSHKILVLSALGQLVSERNKKFVFLCKSAFMRFVLYSIEVLPNL